MSWQRWAWDGLRKTSGQQKEKKEEVALNNDRSKTHMHDKIKAWMEHGRRRLQLHREERQRQQGHFELNFWPGLISKLKLWKDFAAFICPLWLRVNRSFTGLCLGSAPLSSSFQTYRREILVSHLRHFHQGSRLFPGETTFHGVYCFSIKLFKSAFFFQSAQQCKPDY